MSLTPRDDQEPLRVRDDQLEFDEELVYFYKGQRFAGVGYEEVARYGLSEISYNDGLQDGPSRDWYPSGQLKGESIYVKNALHGHAREFREDGSLISDKCYEYGILTESVLLDASGTEVERFVLAEDGPNFAILARYRERFGAEEE